MRKFSAFVDGDVFGSPFQKCLFSTRTNAGAMKKMDIERTHRTVFRLSFTDYPQDGLMEKKYWA